MKHWTDAYVDELLERAKLMRQYGDERGAKAAELHANEIIARRTAFDAEEISIQEAAQESGYSPERLSALRKEGKWSGRRGDLPRHAKASATAVIPIAGDSGTSIADSINGRRSTPTPRRTG